MNESQHFTSGSEPAKAGTEKRLSIPEAAEILGLDSFTVYTLMQHDRILPVLNPWGEFVLLPEDVSKLAMQKD